MTTTTDLAPGFYYDIPEAEYHALPGLSSTGIKALLKSPAHYQWMLEHREERRAYDLGHAAHAKILGTGLGVVVYPDEHLTPSGNISTKAATEAWAHEQRAQGLAPVSPEWMVRVDGMASAVEKHTEAHRLLSDGQPEVSLIWDDPTTGARCRGRIDWLRTDGATDLKTCRDADPRRFGSTAASYGYGEQAIHYLAGLAALGHPVETFHQVLVETEPPHHVSVVRLDATFRLIATERVREAITTYIHCTETGEWPGYVGMSDVTPPAWYGDDAYDDMEV
ncbi:PD-(D/E)XK nuclease-like domain-containing protein [Cellulosimicrobium funkei]|uniref:PD-(D/E)XK nuclease-like domain-containing protein n=1 Tax=Cellulosimicrobium funkei TaxID=264251 RepID=UPI00369F1114